MPRFKTNRYCRDFDKDVIVTVHYKEIATLGGRGRVPTGIKCSGSFNGRCGKCDTCVALKEAWEDTRNRRF